MEHSDSEELMSDSDHAGVNGNRLGHVRSGRAKRKPWAKGFRASRKCQRQKGALLKLARLPEDANLTDPRILADLEKLVQLAEKEGSFIGALRPILFWLCNHLRQYCLLEHSHSAGDSEPALAAVKEHHRRLLPIRTLVERLEKSTACTHAAEELSRLASGRRSTDEEQRQLAVWASTFRQACRTDSEVFRALFIFILELDGHEKSRTLRLVAGRRRGRASRVGMPLGLLQPFLTHFEPAAADRYIEQALASPLSICVVAAEGSEKSILSLGGLRHTIPETVHFDLLQSGASAIATDDFLGLARHLTHFPSVMAEGTAMSNESLETFRRGIADQPDSLLKALLMYCASNLHTLQLMPGSLNDDQAFELVMGHAHGGVYRSEMPGLEKLPGHLVQKLLQVKRCTSCRQRFTNTGNAFIDVYNVQYSLPGVRAPKTHRVAVSDPMHQFCAQCLPHHLETRGARDPDKEVERCRCKLCVDFRTLAPLPGINIYPAVAC